MLLGLGLGAANAAILRHLAATGALPRRAASIATAAGPSTTTTALSGPATPAVIGGAAPPAPGQIFDLVIRGGRVIDPETGYDRVADVGVLGTAIAAISEEPLTGRGAPIDATGLVVAPGFIDILSYSPNGVGEWFKIADGVTTNLGMHGLDSRASTFLGRFEGEGVPINFGGAHDNAWVRSNEQGLRVDQPASPATVDQLVAAARTDLENGFLGIHMQPEYAPGIDMVELVGYGRLAEETGTPLCLHVRYSDNLAPGTQMEAIDEVIRIARETGAWVHVEHLTSTGGTGVMSDALARLEAGRAEGLSISSCIYPYTFWATYLQSERFDNWQEKFGLTYNDLQVAGDADRLTEATFGSAFDANALTAAFAIPEQDIILGMQTPWIMIGSDAILEPSFNNHPRSTGCFSRVLGTYVRDLGAISLIEGLAKMTILPARLLEGRCPALRRKGRLQIGADADITVFDPATVADRSTIATPQLPSAGIEWVLVNGTVVKQPGVGPDPTDSSDRPPGVIDTVRPGIALKAEL